MLKAFAENSLPIIVIIIFLILIVLIIFLIKLNKKQKEYNNILIEFLNNSYLRFGALEQSLYCLLDPKRDSEQIKFLHNAFSDLYVSEEETEEEIHNNNEKQEDPPHV